MNKIISILFAVTVLIVTACKKEIAPIVVNNETPIPECLKVGLKDLDLPHYSTKAIWREGGTCGLKDGVAWKSFISANFSDYPKNTKDYATFNFKNFTASINYPVHNETSSVENIPLKKGVYNITKTNFDEKDKDLLCNTYGITYRNDDVIYEQFVLDVRKINTLEVLKWDEQSKEIYGIYNAYFISEGAAQSGHPEWGTPIVLKDCYFKAIVK